MLNLAHASGPLAQDGDAASNAAARRFLWAVWSAYTLFVVYGSLVPMHFVPLEWPQALQRFTDAPFLNLGIQSRADWVANFLLFVPWSALAMAVWSPAAAALQQGLRAACVCGAGLVFALAIEFTQVFFPGRTVSLNDPLAEGLGAMAGVAMFLRWGAPLMAWLAGWWLQERAASKARRAGHLYLTGLLIYGVMPLDLTISPAEWLHKFNAGGITLLPFSDLPSEPAAWVYAVSTDLLIWLPVGLLWRMDGHRLAAVFLRGVAAAGMLEVLQFFVYSRHTSSSDVIAGALGVMLGAMLSPRHWRAPSAAGSCVAGPATQPGLNGRVLLVWCAWALTMLALFWFPFDIDTRGVFVRPRLQALWAQPLLANFYAGSEFHALTELLRKLGVMLPGGALWVLWWRGAPVAWAKFGRAAGWVWPLGAGALVEAGQLLMPGKFADLTDVLVLACGVWLGAALARYLVSAGRGVPPAARGVVPHLPHAALRRPRGLARLLERLLGMLAAGSACWLLWAGLQATTRPSAPVSPLWVLLWALAVLATVGSVRRPWLAIAAWVAVHFVTPRYGPELTLLNTLWGPLLLAVLAKVGQAGARRLYPVISQPAPLADGLFIAFFAWVGLSVAWHALNKGLAGIDPMYHPANYLVCALLYWLGRSDASSVQDERWLAAVVAAAALVSGLQHAVQGALYGVGQVAFLLVLGLVFATELLRSAAGRGERVLWAAIAAAMTTLVVLNQNRSAMLCMVAVILLWLPRPRRAVGWLLLLGIGLAALAALWRLGLLDRFIVLVDPSWATRPDSLAQASVTSRLALWQATWELVQAAPWLGSGPGWFEALLGHTEPGGASIPAHNTWLTLLGSTGIAGLALGSLAFAAVWCAARPLEAGFIRGWAYAPWSSQRAAVQGLVVCAVFGIANSRADHAWPFFLAGWAARWPLRSTPGWPAGTAAGLSRTLQRAPPPDSRNSTVY